MSKNNNPIKAASSPTESLNLPADPSIKYEVDLVDYNWFRTKGRAKVFIKAKNTHQLLRYLANTNEKNIKIIGAGSNLLIRDGFFDGLVIKLYGEFANIQQETPESLRVGCGALDSTLSKYCLQHNLTGLEFLSGIPGTLGGNIAMNAGCYGSEMLDVLTYVEAIDLSSLRLIRMMPEEMGLSYRKNPMQNILYTFCGLRVQKLESNEYIASRINAIHKDRSDSQPSRVKTSGSTFKNPQGSSKKAWELIDACGLRGMVVGGAMISEKHCNFLVNFNNASSADIEKLIDLAKMAVKNKFGIDLELEIDIL